MGKSQRTKGSSFERKVARFLREACGVDAKRGWQSRGGGKEEPDVVAPGLHIECKAHARVNIKQAIKQATDDTSGELPVAVTKDDRKPVLVTMYLEHWAEFYSAWLAKENNNDEQ